MTETKGERAVLEELVDMIHSLSYHYGKLYDEYQVLDESVAPLVDAGELALSVFEERRHSIPIATDRELDAERALRQALANVRGREDR